MQYREIGNTGMKASIIGMGGEHLDHKPYNQVDRVVGAALEQGVNIIDVFMPGEEIRRNLGKAIGSRRDKVLLQGHIGSLEKDGQYDLTRDPGLCKKQFEGLLTAMGTDYIDLGMLYLIDNEAEFRAVFEGGIADYAQELKKKGVIRAIGASSHDPIIAAKIVETGLVEMMLFSINPAFDLYPAEQNALDKLHEDFTSEGFVGTDPRRAAFYSLCESKGVGLTVMKALGSGKLLSAEHTPFRRPLTVGQCIHYALTRPAVASVLIGYSEPEQVAEAVRYLSLTDEERDYSDAISVFQRDFTGSCVYCNHCQPCPSGIDIASVTRYLDIARLDESHIPPGARQHYGNLGGKGGDCIECGSCVERCPFRVDIIGNMRNAARLFGS